MLTLAAVSWPVPQVLLCGKFEWSLGDLRSVCKYHNYNPTDEIVNWCVVRVGIIDRSPEGCSRRPQSHTRAFDSPARFWETVEELTGQQKRKFLLFVTGTSRWALFFSGWKPALFSSGWKPELQYEVVASSPVAFGPSASL